jgi:small GTP-binding protein
MAKVPDVAVFRGRIVAIGDSSVGKTSLVNRLMEDRFSPNEQMTVGANWQPFTHSFGTERVELQIWDTAGQEHFRSLGPLYYRNAVGAIVVFDVTDRTSFDNLQNWVAAFTAVAGTNVIVVVAANKCDLEEKRTVSLKEGLDWARSRRFQIYETSAKTGQNVAAMFAALAEAVANVKATVVHEPIGDTGEEGTGCC